MISLRQMKSIIIIIAPFKDEFLFDVELLSNLIDKLKRGKAAVLIVYQLNT